MQIVIESERDRRVLNRLVEQAWKDAVASACLQLAGRGRAFPGNLAKVLGLTPPKAPALDSPESAAAQLAAIANLLRVPCGTP